MSPTPTLDASLRGLVDTHLKPNASSFYSAAASDSSGFSSGKDWVSSPGRGGGGGSPRDYHASPDRGLRLRVASIDEVTDSEDENDVVMPLDAGVFTRASATYVPLPLTWFGGRDVTSLLALTSVVCHVCTQPAGTRALGTHQGPPGKMDAPRRFHRRRGRTELPHHGRSRCPRPQMRCKTLP